MRWLGAVILFFAILAAEQSFACDLCSVYRSDPLLSQVGVASLAVSEQYTSFRQFGEPENGEEITTGYSTTQAVGEYNFTRRLSAQLVFPFIAQQFDKFEQHNNPHDDGHMDHHEEDTHDTILHKHSETEEGLGDISLLLNFTPVLIQEGDFGLAWSVSIGEKFPTGDTGAIDNSIRENKKINQLAHHPVGATSGLDGRILSIGTGSWDTIFGTAVSTRWDRAVFTADAQFTLTTEGDFDYRYDNSFLWSVGPGYYLALEHDWSVKAQVVLSGEHKGQDTFEGVHQAGSQVSTLFLGPAITFTAPNQLTGEIGIDLPTQQSLQSESLIATDYRIRASVGMRF